MKYGANLEEIKVGIGRVEWIKVRIEVTLEIDRDLRARLKIGVPAAAVAVTRA
jgi:hypothetical protein